MKFLAERDAIRTKNFNQSYLKKAPTARRRSQARTVAQNYAIDAELMAGLYAQQPAPPSQQWESQHGYLYDRQQDRGHEQE